MRERLRLIPFVVLLLMFDGVHGQGKDGVVVLDLQKAIELALVKNPALKIALDNQNKAESQIKEATAGALPLLSFSSSYTRNVKKPVFFFKLGDEVRPIEIGSNNAYVGNLRFKQTIFENGQLGLGKARRIAHLVSAVSSESTEQTKDEVILNVRQAFYTVILSREVLEVFQESLAQAEAHLENVRHKFEHGMVAEFDLLRSEVQVAEARASLIEAENSLELAKSRLKLAIGLPVENEINIVGTLDYQPVPEDSIRLATRLALERRPELQQLALREEAARLNVAIQKGRRWPNLALVGSYQFQGQSDNFQFGPMERSSSLTTGLELSFNLFDGFRTDAQIQRAEAELDEVLHQREQLTQAIQVEIEQAVLKMKEAQERIEVERKSVQQAEKAYQIAEVRYKNGIGTQLELFDARLALSRVKTNYLRAIYDYNIAWFEWQKAVGIIH